MNHLIRGQLLIIGGGVYKTEGRGDSSLTSTKTERADIVFAMLMGECIFGGGRLSQYHPFHTTH